MVQPAWLELAPAGLRRFTGWKIEHFAWRDLQSFEVYAPSLFSRHIGYILAPIRPIAPAQPKRWAAFRDSTLLRWRLGPECNATGRSTQPSARQVEWRLGVS